VVLVLDAGHGGTDSGASGSLYKEKNLNLAILLGAKKCFDNDGRFQVFYTRTADTYPTLDDRCKLANNNKADIFISIHINWVSNKSITGTLTLRNENRSKSTKKNGITSIELSNAMQAAVLKTTGFTNRGLVNRTDLRVLNKTNMPACLIEYGFISNKNQEKVMHANADRYGRELYDAIVAFMKTKGRIQ
jgi:N-acetylmuramoyl-L-alanine amidase